MRFSPNSKMTFACTAESSRCNVLAFFCIIIHSEFTVQVVASLQDAGSQQIGFLLGSCGVSLALTSEVCLKGLPKTQNGEIIQFKGQ